MPPQGRRFTLTGAERSAKGIGVGIEGGRVPHRRYNGAGHRALMPTIQPENSDPHPPCDRQAGGGYLGSDPYLDFLIFITNLITFRLFGVRSKG